ncbi:hypothetical protein LTR85_009270 [Meristemomyces frigidus]|nr:hypothetical protein LTR85_009270 [Meristemomyces frigidus]
MDALHKHYLALGFRDNRTQETTFLALVRRFLLVNNAHLDEELQRARPDLGSESLASLIVAFMQQYGQRPWPSAPRKRQHLALPRIHKRPRSFVYGFDSHLKAGDKKYWRSRREGRQPSEVESVACSKIGRQLGLYLVEAVRGIKTDVASLTAVITSDAASLMAIILSAGSRAGQDAGDSGVADKVGWEGKGVMANMGDRETEGDGGSAAVCQQVEEERAIKIEEGSMIKAEEEKAIKIEEE